MRWPWAPMAVSIAPNRGYPAHRARTLSLSGPAARVHQRRHPFLPSARKVGDINLVAAAPHSTVRGHGRGGDTRCRLLLPATTIGVATQA
jgi:hypothetical protein